ncbi:stress-activated map kinase interacting protein 1-domain-containing protein [Auriculariales sp. MPI-PUGE-AT-0066]|nr:stress-activated map kinase interacting protein 1-domain-containing protein [Auriculariales sp. MPI-PUGE-AT-0066]
MSLISDPEYIVHTLRLNYLRSISDPYGPRILTIGHTYPQNAHIFPLGARLKHTQTIMGPHRTGLMGPRVDGSRRSSRLGTSQVNTQLAQLSNRVDLAAVPSPTRTKRSDSEPLPSARPAPTSTAQPNSEADENTPAAPDATLTRAQSTRRGATLAPITVRIPSAEEMEGRRRPRYRAHFSSPERKPDEIVAQVAAVENDGTLSGEEDEEGDDMDEDELMLQGVGDDYDEPLPSSTSDNISLMSGASLVSTSAVARNLREPAGPSTRGRLSPVSEAHNQKQQPTGQAPHPSSRRQGSINQPIARGSPTKTSSNGPDPASRKLHTTPSQQRVTSPVPSSLPVLSFAKVQIAGATPKRSALTALLAAQNATDNPFAELYSLIAARSDAQGMKLTVFVHFARSMTKLVVNVRKDASVEEVIGHALFMYWEEKKEPKLDADLTPDAEEARNARFSAVGWSLRIAEFDGEPDEDFPAPDRARRIGTFGQHFALQLASAQQIKHHVEQEAKIQRRPSRVMVAKKKTAPSTAANAESAAPTPPPQLDGLKVPSSLVLPPSSTVSTSMLNNIMPGSVGVTGEEILLKVHVANKTDDLAYVTVKVTPATYMQEVLEQAARKRRWTDLADAVLLTQDMKIVIPLDRTVASLQGNRHIVLARRSYFNQLGISGIRQFGRSTDPNASIFKRASEVPEARSTSGALTDVTTAYKKFTVQRKLPMILKRQERVLAIDGDYVHIMPSQAGRGPFLIDNMKTSSYHVKSISNVLNVKNSATFRLSVGRETGEKQYEFEAESDKLCAEIVQSIRQLQKRYLAAQAGTGASGRTKSRRSRAAG